MPGFIHLSLVVVTAKKMGQSFCMTVELLLSAFQVCNHNHKGAIMATIITSTVKQSLAEKRQWDFDFNGDLPTGVTVSSATATHTPPSGSAETPAVGSIVSGVVPVRLDTLTVEGNHLLRCTATFSDGEISEILLYINVIA